MDITKEQQEDIDNRVAEFKTRYEALVTELQVDFITYVQKMQIGPNTYADAATMQIMDKKYLAIESPLSNMMIEQ